MICRRKGALIAVTTHCEIRLWTMLQLCVKGKRCMHLVDTGENVALNEARDFTLLAVLLSLSLFPFLFSSVSTLLDSSVVS